LRGAGRGEVWGGDLPPPQSTMGLGERHKVPQRGLGGRAPAANDFWALHTQFRAISCIFSAFWNLTGKANKTDPIRPLLPAIDLEGARAPVPPPSGSTHGFVI